MQRIERSTKTIMVDYDSFRDFTFGWMNQRQNKNLFTLRYKIKTIFLKSAHPEILGIILECQGYISLKYMHHFFVGVTTIANSDEHFSNI
jgi:hypothetical protein